MPPVPPPIPTPMVATTCNIPKSCSVLSGILSIHLVLLCCVNSGSPFCFFFLKWWFLYGCSHVVLGYSLVVYFLFCFASFHGGFASGSCRYFFVSSLFLFFHLIAFCLFLMVDMLSTIIFNLKKKHIIIPLVLF